MKVTTTERIIVETIYECEGCGHQYDFEVHTEACPKHGEFCTNCVDKAENTYPFVICPRCKPLLEDLNEDLYLNNVCRYDSDAKLREPWVLLGSELATGYWIGCLSA